MDVLKKSIATQNPIHAWILHNDRSVVANAQPQCSTLASREARGHCSRYPSDEFSF
jgi:hypothetical protein